MKERAREQKMCSGVCVCVCMVGVYIGFRVCVKEQIVCSGVCVCEVYRELSVWRPQMS